MNNESRSLDPTLSASTTPCLPSKDLGEDPLIIEDKTIQQIQFNVMPGRPVSETLRPKEYRVWNRYVEAEFDREYYSSMSHSPDHLIFLTALIQVQRILYLYMCCELRQPYEPLGPEILKIWPTNVNVEMPKMLMESEGLVHRLAMIDIRKLGAKSFFAESKSDVSGIVEIRASGIIYLI